MAENAERVVAQSEVQGSATRRYVRCQLVGLERVLREAIVDPLQQRLFPRPDCHPSGCSNSSYWCSAVSCSAFDLDAISFWKISSCVTSSGLPSVPIRLLDSAGVIESCGFGSIASGAPRGGTSSSSAQKPCLVGTARAGGCTGPRHDRPPPPQSGPCQPVPSNPARDGPVTSRSVLGGLLRAYGGPA